jgi:hypothetical protein
MRSKIIKLLIVQDGMNIDYNYYDTTYFIKKKEKKEFTMYCMLLQVLFMVHSHLSNFFKNRQHR